MKSLEPYHSGKPILVEDCQRVEISALLRKAKERLKQQLLTVEISISELRIELTPSKTALGGTRYWFKCPSCARRVSTLFVHPLTSVVGCRKCLELEYRSRRYKGMVESGITRSEGG